MSACRSLRADLGPASWILPPWTATEHRESFEISESIAWHGRLKRRSERRHVSGRRDSRKKSINNATVRMCATGGSIA
jgi:hypothetical protein